MSETKGEKAWYAIHTYSGYEKKVESNLKKRIETMNMEDYIFQCIVPIENVRVTQSSGKTKEVERKIFPGYVLVEMIRTDESWYVVRNTEGVTGFVGAGNTPVPLEDYEVENVFRQMGEDVVPRRIFDLEVGDEVEILESSFRGYTGKIAEIDTDKERAVVLITMFNNDTEASIDLTQLRKVE